MCDGIAQTIASLMRAGTRAIAVEVVQVRGSSPRDCDAVMLVSADGVHGTIGGGALEWTAIEHARDLLNGSADDYSLDLPLGPMLGQCCGGHVALAFRVADAAYAAALARREREAEEANAAVLIFGAGHVGRALAQALLPLPLRATFVDPREQEIAQLPPGAHGLVVADPVQSVIAAEPGTSYVIMTHEHIQDFVLMEAALHRRDALYIGMIGSSTKRARFLSWMQARHSDPSGDFACPIGNFTVDDKRPGVIAALMASELLVKVHAKRFGERPVRASRRAAQAEASETRVA